MATFTNKYNLKKPAPSDFADVADLNGNMDIIDGALGDKANITYCTCGSTAGASVKVATVSAGKFSLTVGASVDVKFTYSNTASAPGLNVNDTGAKIIKMYGTTAPSAYMWQAGAVVRFIYDGTNWIMQNGTLATTTYYGVTKLNSSVNSTSTAEAATPSAVKQAYDLANDASRRAILPRLIVTAPTGTTVTVSLGQTTYTKEGGGQVTFDLPSYGDWLVTAGNYSSRIKIDAVKMYGITALSLQDATWAQIAEMSANGKASLMWAVGDEKDITVGDETLTLVIMDFNHDICSDGSGRAGITFGLKNLMATTRRMEATNTNANGFTGSEMYTWLQSELLSSFPEDLQSVLKLVDKKTSAGAQGTEINTNSMKVFLFSEVEVFGTVTYSVEGEGTQYPYFATAANRKKYLANGTGSANNWWERSPRANYSTYFCGVNSSGGAYNVSASNARGVCFGFCV